MCSVLVAVIFALGSLITVGSVGLDSAAGAPPAECLLPNPPPSCAPDGVGSTNTIPVPAECLLPNPPPSCSPIGTSPTRTKVTDTTVPKSTLVVAKVGGACKKAGVKGTTSGGVSVTCTKVVKKLLWQKTKTKPPALAGPPPLIDYKLPAEYKKIFAGPDYEQSSKLPTDFILGHTITDYFSDAIAPYVDSTMQSVKNSGVGWVVFDNYYTYTSLEPPIISPFPRVGYEKLPYHMREATDAELISMIKSAHAKGLKFFLSSELNLDGLSKGANGVTPELIAEQGKYEKRLEELGAALSNPTPEVSQFWDDWFLTYGDYVVHQADIAQQNGVEMLSIGKQLGGATAEQNVGRWKALINRVRAHYSGPIVYVALEGKDFSEAAGFPAWSDVDAIMMTLGNLAPETTGKTVAQIREAMKSILAERYKPFASEFGKKVILLTYFQGATTQEWFESGPLTGGHAFIIKDLLAQAKLYEALFQVIKNEDWISGVLTWSYYWKDDLTSLVLAGDSAYDKSSNVRNMPAMEIIKKWAPAK